MIIKLTSFGPAKHLLQNSTIFSTRGGQETEEITLSV